jgi:hypothetical protein
MAKNLINRLQKQIPRGAPFSSAELHDLGISNDLIQQYVRSNWLERLARGVFMHAGDTLDRDSTLVFLETRIDKLHFAAKTALALHGYQHNLSKTPTPIIWGAAQSTLPDWFTKRFPCRYSGGRLFNESIDVSTRLQRLPEAPRGPLVAEPELALLEMLSEVGVNQQLDEARLIMESMRQIRSKRLGQLLAACTRVKAVRLCVYLALQMNMSWAQKALETAPVAMLQHRWVMRLPNGSTMTLPAIEKKGVS